MKKLLLIVDPQYDFITGTLPVAGAIAAMDALAVHLFENGYLYSHIAITADWHPWCHCSFAGEGGDWPRHCVAFSRGASIWKPLLDAAMAAAPTLVLTKGTGADREEYSIFANEASAAALKELVDSRGIEEIDICGLAGDVCVLNTARDAVAIFGKDRVKVLPRFCASLDGGSQLSMFVKRRGLEAQIPDA